MSRHRQLILEFIDGTDPYANLTYRHRPFNDLNDIPIDKMIQGAQVIAKLCRYPLWNIYIKESYSINKSGTKYNK